MVKSEQKLLGTAGIPGPRKNAVILSMGVVGKKPIGVSVEGVLCFFSGGIGEETSGPHHDESEVADMRRRRWGLLGFLAMLWGMTPAFGASRLPVDVENDEIYIGDSVVISFQRTLRVPDDGRRWELPPGLGRFPIRRVDDYASRVPASWRRQGGVIIPMYQREALWIDFRSSQGPAAVKVAAGMVNALTGDSWSERLSPRQDYLVVPDQPWLDGFNTGRGVVRQFVAMPLGSGGTVEGQLTGQERYGGIQIMVFPAKEFWRDRLGEQSKSSSLGSAQSSPGMGLGEGGKISQRILRDSYGYETWDQRRTGRIYVHIVNSRLWRAITGEPLPPTPIRFETYQQYNLPWSDFFGEDDLEERGQSVPKPREETFERVPAEDDGSVRDGDW